MQVKMAGLTSHLAWGRKPGNFAKGFRQQNVVVEASPLAGRTIVARRIFSNFLLCIHSKGAEVLANCNLRPSQMAGYKIIGHVARIFEMGDDATLLSGHFYTGRIPCCYSLGVPESQKQF